MARNHVGRAGPDFQTPDGRDEIGFSARARLDRQRHFGGGGQRVAAQAHRRRAGMAGHAVHPDLEPGRAVDGGNDAERQTLRLQHRPLFDMGLDEGGDIARADRTRLFGIAAESLQGVAHRDPASVPLVERILEVGAGERPRTRQRCPETDALLIPEGDDLDGVVEPLAAALSASTTASAASAP